MTSIRLTRLLAVRTLAALLAVGALLAGATAASAQAPAVDKRGVAPSSPNPLVGERWFSDETWGLPARAARALAKRGKARKAAAMRRFAERPQFRWMGKWTKDASGSTAGGVRQYIERVQAEQPGAVPQLVTMRRDAGGCGPRYRGGGRAEDARTRRWWDEFARGVGDERVIIAFEPDSLGTVRCLAKSRRRARIALLRYGVDVMSKLPNATVYVEAGASDWEPAWLTAKKLRMVGVHKVRGFMLNVTHYDWTRNNIRYGVNVSRRIGGKPFVINTAQNGRGAVHLYRRKDGRKRRFFVRCPLRRGLGPAPTTNTAHPLVDAYLYIANSGGGGGYCKGQDGGGWDLDRALMFVRFATEWIKPPKGTRHGLYKRLKPRQLTGAKDNYTRRTFGRAR